MHPLRTYLLRFTLLLLSFGVEAKANTRNKHQETATAAIESMQRKEVFAAASIGCYAVNLTKDTVITDFNGARSIIPASTLKLITTAAALEILGKDFCFTTTLQYDGEIDEEGTLHGNIYIKGGGDPTLGSRQFKEYYAPNNPIATWVKAVQAQGIHKITGAIIGDAQIYTSHTTPDTWIWEDMANYYGASCSGLSIFDNTYTLLFDSDAKAGVLTKISAIVPTVPHALQIMNQVKSSARNVDLAYIYGGPYTYNKVARGTIPLAQKDFAVKGAMPDPAYWAAFSLARALQEQGIKTACPPATMSEPPAEEKNRAIHTLLSPPLHTIVQIVNQKSFNLYAEHLLVHVGLVQSGQGDSVSGTKAVKAFWAQQGINVAGMFICDGSGLSRYNGITPKQFVAVLKHMKKSKNATAFYQSLATAGETGNLKDLFKKAPLKGNIVAKSGTLSNVRSFAGYCKNNNGDDIAFAITVNYYTGPRSGAEKEIEKKTG